MLPMFVIHRQKQVRMKKTDILCDKAATFVAVIIVLQERCMTDQDPSGFIPCPSGNGTDAFVHLEVLLFMGMLLGAPTHHCFIGEFGI